MKTELPTTLKRQTTKILADSHETMEPVPIAEHRQPSAHLLNVDDYEIKQDRLKILEGISRGETAILEDRVFSHAKAKEKMSKWLC